ncbi:hypothetical protein N9954_06810 [Maribacter sp.]|nr:hypothetical protein [Maribacter sp.]
MACHQYNPNPIVFPVPPGRKTQLSDEDENLFLKLIMYYQRFSSGARIEEDENGVRRTIPAFKPNKNDSIILSGAHLKLVQEDPEVSQSIFLVISRQVTRAKQFLARLDCGEEGCFEDSGQFLTPTKIGSDLSYSLGKFTIFWKSKCQVGPKQCHNNMPNCPSGSGATARYELTIDWRIFDVYDFTGFQYLAPPAWGGTDFYVFGDWQSVTSGSLSICDTPSPDTIPESSCQDDQLIYPAYNIAYQMTGIRNQCSIPDKEAIINSAMVRLLEDGKLWCREGLCDSEKDDCEPYFSGVTIELGKIFSENLNEELKQCYVRVRIAARVHCRCMNPADVQIPTPDNIIDQMILPPSEPLIPENR